MAAGEPAKLTPFVFSFLFFIYLPAMNRTERRLEESGISVAPPERPRAASSTIPPPLPRVVSARRRRADASKQQDTDSVISAVDPDVPNNPSMADNNKLTPANVNNLTVTDNKKLTTDSDDDDARLITTTTDDDEADGDEADEVEIDVEGSQNEKEDEADDEDDEDEDDKDEEDEDGEDEDEDGGRSGRAADGLVDQDMSQVTPRKLRIADSDATPRQATRKRERQSSSDSGTSKLGKVTRRSTSHSTTTSSHHTSPSGGQPPRSLSPESDLQGASRITGGISRGKAVGNVFNMADRGKLIFIK